MLIPANLVTSVLLFIIWIIAGTISTRLAYRQSLGRLRSSATKLLIMLAIGELILAAQVTVTIIEGLRSWWFIQDKILLQLPYMLLPAIAVGLLSFPKLWKIA